MLRSARKSPRPVVSSMSGYDVLRSGIAMPSSMVHCYDATQGDVNGSVPDLVTGDSIQYSGSGIGFDDTGRMTGIEYTWPTPNVVDVADYTHTSGDHHLLISCGELIDYHVPSIEVADDPVNGAASLGADCYAGVLTNGGDGCVVITTDTDTTIVDTAKYTKGTVAYLDDENDRAYLLKMSTGEMLSGTTNGLGATGFTKPLHLNPSSQGEAFTAIMRWSSGEAPPLSVIQDAMRWMWREWALGNYTIYPPLLLNY